jgi:hypothetical protein
VRDQDRVLAAVEGVVEGHGVGHHHARVDVVAVRRKLRGREAAVERRHGAIAGVRELGQEVPVGPGRVREAVEAERQGPVAGRQVGEAQAVRVDGAVLEVGHVGLLSCGLGTRATLPRSAR